MRVEGPPRRAGCCAPSPPPPPPRWSARGSPGRASARAPRPPGAAYSARQTCGAASIRLPARGRPWGCWPWREPRPQWRHSPAPPPRRTARLRGVSLPPAGCAASRGCARAAAAAPSPAPARAPATPPRGTGCAWRGTRAPRPCCCCTGGGQGAADEVSVGGGYCSEILSCRIKNTAAALRSSTSSWIRVPQLNAMRVCCCTVVNIHTSSN